MKITDVKAYPLKTRTAFVRIFTDEGVEGIGECSPMNVPIMCYFVEHARARLGSRLRSHADEPITLPRLPLPLGKTPRSCWTERVMH